MDFLSHDEDLFCLSAPDDGLISFLERYVAENVLSFSGVSLPMQHNDETIENFRLLRCSVWPFFCFQRQACPSVLAELDDFSDAHTRYSPHHHLGNGSNRNLQSIRKLKCPAWHYDCLYERISVATKFVYQGQDA